MGVFDKFLDIMKLNDDDYDDDDFYDDDDYYDEEEYEEKPRHKLFGKKNKKEEKYDDFDVAEDKDFQPAESKVTPMRPSAKRTGNMEVCVVKPTSVDDSREITETLLSGRTVILNLEGMDLEIAQRIIDFISGATYAISGNLQKISNYIFLVTPTNVDISGDLQDLLRRLHGDSEHERQILSIMKDSQTKEIKLLEKRFTELSRLAYQRDIITYSDFLNLSEQNILHTLPKDTLYSRYVSFGGYELQSVRWRHLSLMLFICVTGKKSFLQRKSDTRSGGKGCAPEPQIQRGTHTQGLSGSNPESWDRTCKDRRYPSHGRRCARVRTRRYDRLYPRTACPVVRHTSVTVSEVPLGEVRYTPLFRGNQGNCGICQA